MTSPVTFTVLGPAALKGSTVSFIRRGRVVTKPDCRALWPWTQACGWAARQAKVPLAPKGTGVTVEVVYELPRPTRTVGRTHPCVRPDVDKLARALLDALTGIAYEDDGQVVALHVLKIYGPAPIARVTVATV